MTSTQAVVVCGGGAMAGHSIASLIKYEHVCAPELLGLLLALWLVIRVSRHET